MSSVSCFLKRENEKGCLGMKMMSQEAVEVIVVQTVILDLLAQG